MSINLKNHEYITSKELIIEEIIIKDKKPYKKKRKIIIYFIRIIIVLLSIILFNFFHRYYKKYKKINTLYNFHNAISSNIIIVNKTHINTKKNIIKNNSQYIIDNDIHSNKTKTVNIYPWEKEKLIMHALGKYNQTIYTNSLDALNYWYFKEKMTIMEADFHLTKDNHIVLAHDFNHLESIPNLKEFKNKIKTRGNLTPMTFEDLVIFMEKKKIYILLQIQNIQI